MSNPMNARVIKDLSYSWYLKILTNSNFERIFNITRRVNPELHSHSYNQLHIFFKVKWGPLCLLSFKYFSPQIGEYHYDIPKYSVTWRVNTNRTKISTVSDAKSSKYCTGAVSTPANVRVLVSGNFQWRLERFPFKEQLEYSCKWLGNYLERFPENPKLVEFRNENHSIENPGKSGRKIKWYRNSRW